MANFGPRPMDFSTLGDLGNAFFSAYDGAQKRARENEKRAALADLGRGFDTLNPEGMKQVAGKLVSLGDIGSGVQLLSSAAALEKQARDDAAFSGFMGQVGGGQPQQPAGQEANGYGGPAPKGYDNPQSRALYDAAIKRGYQPHQAAAIVGSGALPESTLNPDARNPGDGRDGSDSVGMFQWNGSRANALRQYAATKGRAWNDPQLQADFYLDELDGPERAAGALLRTAKTPEEAARAVVLSLRPAGIKGGDVTGVPSWSARLNNTLAIHGAFNQGGGQQSAGAAGGPVKVAQANAGLPPDDPMPGIPTRELFRYAASPNARVAAAAKMAYEGRQRWAMEQGKGTDVQRNYERARQQGYTGTILDYQKELRQQVTVNNDLKQETEESKAIGKAAGEAASDVFKAGAKAGQTLQRLNRMADLLDRVQTGKLTPAQMTVAQWGKALGFSDDTMKGLGLNPESVGSAEALQGLINQAVTGMIGAGGFPANNFSDADRKFLERSFPELQKTPEGNRLILETLRISAERDRDKATAYAKWRKENKGSSFYDFETQWDASNASGPDRLGKVAEQAQRIAPPQAAQGQGQGGIPRVNSPADAMKLPKGSRFVAPDGSIRVVP